MPPARRGANERLQALVFRALDLAETQLTPSGSITPFALVVDDGELYLRPFPGDDAGRALSGALAYASVGDYDAWAVAWTGTLPGVSSGDLDAIAVQAGCRDEDREHLFAQLLRRDGIHLRGAGNPLYLGSMTDQGLEEAA